jgi:hypothetical protein
MRTEGPDRSGKSIDCSTDLLPSCIILSRDQRYVATRAQDLRQGVLPIRSAGCDVHHCSSCAYPICSGDALIAMSNMMYCPKSRGHNNLMVHGRVH